MISNTDFKIVIDEMLNIFSKKNHDYGDSFEKTMNEFGLVSSAVRLSDKMNRFKSLISSECEVQDEKIEDTLLDLANYAILTTIWIRKNDLSSNKEPKLN